MPIAVIEFAFDPVLRLGDAAVRLETLAIALAILATLILAGRIAGSTPAHGEDPGPFVHRSRLRRDDLLFIALGAVPGAVAGGRLGHALLHLDYYAAHPVALVDPAQGSAELGLAVVGGTLTGAVVAALLEGPVGRWLHVATLPVLTGLAVGKLALVLGGDGQGAPSQVPWATSYGGSGPWGSLAAATPSHPAQLYEAAATAAVLLVMVGLLAAGRFRSRDGTAFLVAVALWAAARALVATSWRDAPVLGPLNAAQLLALAIAAGAAALAVARARRLVGRDADPEGRRAIEAAWPDPATRPRF